MEQFSVALLLTGQIVPVCGKLAEISPVHCCRKPGCPAVMTACENGRKSVRPSEPVRHDNYTADHVVSIE